MYYGKDGELMSAKMGRPTDNPKTKQIMVRLDQKCQQVLEEYAKQYNITMAEAARRGILKLEADTKKK